jgi:hypothetical protein
VFNLGLGWLPTWIVAAHGARQEHLLRFFVPQGSATLLLSVSLALANDSICRQAEYRMASGLVAARAISSAGGLLTDK